MRFRILYRLILILAILAPLGIARAQDEQPSGAVYLVQPGDTLWGISRVFNVSIDDIAALNGIADPSQLSVGARLLIPGLEGLSGELVISTVPYGENFRSLSRRYQIPYGVMARLNRYTTPEDVAAGAPLIILALEGESGPSGGRATLRTGQSLLELAITQNTSPYTLAAENGLLGTWDAFPGDVLHISGIDDHGPGALPEAITGVELSPFPAVQGETLVYHVRSAPGVTLGGSIAGRALNFFPYENESVALQGIRALLEPGYYPSVISGTLEDGTPFEYAQKVYIQDGGYPYDSPLVVDSETIDVENTKPEDLEWLSIVEAVTPERMWAGVFSVPVPAYWAECYPSTFGNRRSYNGSAYIYYHTGLDFCGGEGSDIYAPAPGIVVFTGEMVVRGNATVIDHGWGVYTAYAHQSEILVKEGDRVETGQVIGLVGRTGRVTGPHLHWEVIVNGIQVNPLDWLARAYP